MTHSLLIVESPSLPHPIEKSVFDRQIASTLIEAEHRLFFLCPLGCVQSLIDPDQVPPVT